MHILSSCPGAPQRCSKRDGTSLTKKRPLYIITCVLGWSSGSKAKKYILAAPAKRFLSAAEPQGAPGRPREPQGAPGSPRRPQEAPGSPREPQGAPGGPRRPQGAPGSPREPQGAPGSPRRPQGAPGSRAKKASANIVAGHRKIV